MMEKKARVKTTRNDRVDKAGGFMPVVKS